MGVLRPLLVVCSALFLAAATSAQSTSTPPATSDPQAVALIQRSLAALTSGATITDVTLTGTARRIAGSDDESGTSNLKATALGDSAVTLNLPSGVRTEIRNHSAVPIGGSLPPNVPTAAAQAAQAAGAWSGPDGVLHGMAAHNVMTDAAWFFPALTFEKLLASQNYVLSYVGQETHNGATVLRVSATQQFAQALTSSTAPAPFGPPIAQVMQHLSQMDFYFDPTSSLPVTLDFNQHPDNNALLDIPVEIRFSDYTAESGATVPLEVQKYLNNGLVLDLQFNSVNVNSGLPASVFAIQ